MTINTNEREEREKEGLNLSSHITFSQADLQIKIKSCPLKSLSL